ncbi:uncharacterized protein LOC114931042 [Nylanderia fulva]|uniref:uncharacterized protein LOC114931042 n=1 Tax=Nylanderia fulva TaxID=613905 RepID=UPI0010FB0CEF|nr:uncharacterized protein LOC114931042 [Nylanderia fulva]
MLIINIIFFICAICCTVNIASSTGTFVSLTTRSKRAIINSGHEVHNNQERFRGTTSRISLPQDITTRSLSSYGSAIASQPKRISYTNSKQDSSHAYGSVPRRPLPTSVPLSVDHTKSYRNNPLVSYFNILNNSNLYKTTTSKPLDASKPTASQSLQKLQGIYLPNAFHQKKSIGFSEFEYPSYASISKLISQDAQNGASSSTIQVPTYKTNYPLSKVIEDPYGYTLNFPTVLNVSPSLDKTSQNSKQKDEATTDVNGKKISAPIIQFQSNADFSEVSPIFGSQPFFLSANYPTESDLAFNFGTGPKLNMALQSRNVSPFLSPLSSFQGQIVPIQTANNSPQFPQYKGASVKVYPVPNNVPKVQGSYESLYSQPQLHFGQQYSNNVQPIKMQQNIVHPPVSTEGILNDVEIINKKNPEPHTPQSDDDDRNDGDDDDDRDDKKYKNPDKENEDSSEDDDAEPQPRKYFNEPPTESDFKPSSSYPFKEYDERFGKYKAQIDDNDSEDKPHSSYKHDSKDDDEEEEEEEEEKEEEDSSSEYRTEYTDSPKSSNESYEEEDEEEEESIKHQRREEATDSDEMQPKQSKYHGKDFEHEFEESYRKELPKHKYVHIKEVPEIDSYNNPIYSKRQQKNNNQSHVNHGQYQESTNQEFQASRKNRRIPKAGYKDNTAYGSDVFAKKAPKMIYEEYFEYKNPEIEKYSKHSKTKAIAIEKYSPKKEDSYLRAAKYYKVKHPKIDSKLAFKNENIPINIQKSAKYAPEKIRSNVKQLSDIPSTVPFYGPNVVSKQIHSFTNAKTLDLTGI